MWRHYGLEGKASPAPLQDRSSSGQPAGLRPGGFAILAPVSPIDLKAVFFFG